MRILHESKIIFCPQRTLATRAALAETFWSRLRGLMFRKSFGGLDAVILDKCRAMHTFFMKFAIDVVCLDYSDEVSGLFESIRPGKILIFHSPTSAIVELPRGTIRKYGLCVGDNLIVRN